MAGCYVHGVFDDAEACDTLLIWAGLQTVQAITDYQQHRLAQLDRLADAVAEHVSADLL